MLTPPDAMQVAVAEKRTQSGGDWFFWIAGFSVVNSVLALVGTNIHFVIGLGTTELIDSISPAKVGRAGAFPWSWTCSRRHFM